MKAYSNETALLKSGVIFIRDPPPLVALTGGNVPTEKHILCQDLGPRA